VLCCQQENKLWGKSNFHENVEVKYNSTLGALKAETTPFSVQKYNEAWNKASSAIDAY